jgi:hypothetical protein
MQTSPPPPHTHTHMLNTSHQEDPHIGITTAHAHIGHVREMTEMNTEL